MRSSRLGGLQAWGSQAWVSDLVLGSQLDPCHDLLEFIGESGTGSHWPSRDRWRPQIGCDVVQTFPQYRPLIREGAMGATHVPLVPESGWHLPRPCCAAGRGRATRRSARPPTAWATPRTRRI